MQSMPETSGAYLPTEPLAEYLDDRNLPRNDRLRAEALGISRGNYHKLMGRGRINWVMADRYAVNLGAHPALIWENWYQIIR